MAETLNHAIGLLNRAGDLHWHFAVAMFVQVGILVAVLLGVDWCLRRRVRPVFRYWMWMLVVVKLVLPVSLGSPTSPAYWLADYRPVPVVADGLAETPVRSATWTAGASTPRVPDETIVGLAHHATEAPRGVPANDARAPAATLPVQSAGVVSAVVPASAATVPAPIQVAALRPTAWLFLAWLGAVAVLLGGLGWRTLRVRRLVQRAAEAPADLGRLLDECRALAYLRPRRTELRLSDDLGSPAVCGLWRPTVLLPRPLVDRLDRHQLRLVFVHELAHWKRGDLQVNWLQTLLGIVYFYNPAVWIANAALRRLREQAVDETVLVALGPQSERYPATLLDVAALAVRPVEFALRLTGVVESRKALSQRIRRIASRGAPKSARLGLVGLAAIVVMGLVLLPMAASDRSRAETADRPAAAEAANDEASDAPRQRDAGATPEQAPEPLFTPLGALSGRVTDETGAPVAGVAIQLTDPSYRENLFANTDEHGCYHFDESPEPGEYLARVSSQEWADVTDARRQPRVHVATGSQLVRHFRVRRVYRIRVQTVDREGRPVGGVSVLVKPLASERLGGSKSVGTNKEGWAAIGGLEPSESGYLIATISKNHGFAKLVVKPDDPKQVTSYQIVLDEGVEVEGTAVCSDGKPPVGWRVNALPTWWDFGHSPMGEEIGADGSFTLPHVADDKYNVTISVPMGGSTASPRTVRSSVALPEEGPLSVTLDYPSPGSMTSITGRIRYVGGVPKRGFWIHGRSEDRQYSGDAYLQPGQEEFEIGPVPAAVYNIEFESPEIEAKTLRGIPAPTENLEVEITVTGKPVLRGSVVLGDTNEPVARFRARVTKVRTLRGPNYVVEPRWHEFSSPQGQFEIEVPGPGIYVVHVAVDGFAPARSEPINTDDDAGKPVRVELGRGVSLSGTVVDERGAPVDGALVVPLSKASGGLPAGATLKMLEEVPQSVFLRLFKTEDGAVKTVDGRFTFDQLPPGGDVLKVTHPDYCFAIARSVAVGEDRDAEELKITLTRGGTVRGHVYDENGKPAPNVTLLFQNQEGYAGPTERKAGGFPTAVTDENGYYEAQGLPDELCHVRRAEEGQCLGVVRQAILPQNGKTHTLDLGGKTMLAGRLLVNGDTLSTAKLLLADENPNFGVFRAFAQTAHDGSFVFYGPQPGKRTLYYAPPGRRNDWVRVQDVRVTAQDADLGNIDHVARKVVVRCMAEEGKGLDDVRVVLQQYNPIWPHGNRVGALLARENPDDPFVFEQVPPGKYELVVRPPGGFLVRQLFEVTAAGGEQEVTCRLPIGSASLSGKIDGAICGPGGCRALKMWSKDRRLLGYIAPKEDGTYRLDNVPAGDYVVREKDTRDADVILELSLKDRENKTLDFTPEVVSASGTPRGFATVTLYTAEGVPFPCDLELEGADGTRLPPNSSQRGVNGFTGAPGSYTLSVAYPGFKPLRAAVELKPVGEDGRAAKGYDVRLHLEPRDR